MLRDPYHPCINIVFESGRKWNRYFYIWFDTQFFGFNLQSEIFINTERVIAGNPTMWKFKRSDITREVCSTGVVLSIYFSTIAIIFGKTY